MRHNMKEIVPSMDSNLTFSLLKLMECFFKPFMPKEVKQTLNNFTLIFNIRFGILVFFFVIMLILKKPEWIILNANTFEFNLLSGLLLIPFSCNVKCETFRALLVLL